MSGVCTKLTACTTPWPLKSVPIDLESEVSIEAASLRASLAPAGSRLRREGITEQEDDRPVKTQLEAPGDFCSPVAYLPCFLLVCVVPDRAKVANNGLS